MGKVQVGILDGFVGKVGTVVGSFWKGLPVMRAYKRAVANPQTNAQQLIRARFATIGTLSSAFYAAIKVGFKAKARAKKMTEGDIFVQLNWDYVTATTPSTVTVDYPELTIAQGHLPEAQFGTASFALPLQVEVPMDDTSELIGASALDTVYLFVYSPEAGAGVIDGGHRSDESIKVVVPAYWNGHRVHVWGFAVGGGSDNAGVISNSRYIGAGTIS